MYKVKCLSQMHLQKPDRFYLIYFELRFQLKYYGETLTSEELLCYSLSIRFLIWRRLLLRIFPNERIIEIER